MKARLSLYTPDVMPDIAALTARYERLIFMVKVLILSGDYAGVLTASYDLARAAKALVKGKARAAAIERKLQMLITPAWRSRVISDLGGMRKLALWNAAMLRAIERSLTPARPQPKPQAAGWQPPHILAAQTTESERRAHIRKCLKATARPGIIKDRYRVDFEGQFCLPPVPRAPSGAGESPAPSAYTYDPRKFSNQSGVFQPAMVWPAEFYIAERGELAVPDAPVVTADKTPGVKHPRPGLSDSDFGQAKTPPPQTAYPADRHPVFAPP